MINRCVLTAFYQCVTLNKEIWEWSVEILSVSIYTVHVTNMFLGGWGASVVCLEIPQDMFIK